MEHVKQLHMNTCKSFQPILDFSLDGIQECKSSSLSADVFSVSFQGCKTVYPVRIIRQINKFKVDEQDQIKQVIDDINSCHCQIKTCICDNPKRSQLRCSLCHSASYACEYCECKAKYISYKTINQKLKGHLAWPSSTYGGPARTREKILEITERLVNGEILTRDEAKGFIGTSHLLHQENFDFIACIPAEYMHSGCIGTVKRMLELTFNVGETRKRNTKRKLSDVAQYNILICYIQVPFEFNRRYRNMDFGVMKAQEHRNVCLFFFPLILECIPDEFPKEKKVWLQLAYLLRSCILPNEEFEKISKKLLELLSKSFYKNYESVYGTNNCTYSIHVIACHILQIRGDEPLTSSSAFKFENFYSELRNLFQPGTISPSKQILRNCYMKRLLENHNCEKSIKFDTEKKGKECNSRIYCIDENKELQFFNIIKKNDNGSFTCNPQGRHIFKSELTKDLKWENVGVFKVGPYADEEVIITRKNICGKVLKVKDFFITCPNNVLRKH